MSQTLTLNSLASILSNLNKNHSPLNQDSLSSGYMLDMLTTIVWVGAARLTIGPASNPKWTGKSEEAELHTPWKVVDI